MKEYHLDIRSSATRHISDLGPKVKIKTEFGLKPRIGDVVIGQIVKIGQHFFIEDPFGHEILLHPGNICALVLGNRYSTREFYGEVPNRLNLGDEFSLLNIGGISGEAKQSNILINDPTRLTYLGHACGKGGERINTFDHAPSAQTCPSAKIPIIFVVGTDMDSGKTSTCGLVIRILSENGWQVGAGKITGTSRMKDILYMKACGAEWIADFMDLGFPSTSLCTMKDLEGIWDGIRSLIMQEGCHALVLEIADGILQPETELIFFSSRIMKERSLLVLAADGSVSAFGAIEHLSNHYHIRPDFLSGLIINSNLSIKEITAKIDIPILNNQTVSRRSLIERLHKKGH